jgi:CBS-domain-containing membrane protein
MKARDVMGTYVITVGPDLDVAVVAKILLKNRISAVPVVSPEGRLLGIVSEGDLIRRSEAQTERRHSWWLGLFGSAEMLAKDFVKANARKAGDVMTRKVVTATPNTSLREIADLLEKNNIKRVPIVEGGHLFGIVSRANLIQALASRRGGVAGIEAVDEKLRDAVLANLRKQPGNTALVTVIAEAGVITLWGFVESEDEKKAIRVAAEITPGVRAVNDNIQIHSLAMAV